MPFRCAVWIIAALLPALASAEPPLETAPAEHRELPREIRLDGAVEAIRQATVSAQTGGQVEEILFDVDDYVEQGALIIRLRDTEHQARLSQVEAELQEAQARLTEARNAHDRTRKIYEKKLIARAQVDQAEAALKAAQARFDAASAGLRQAREQFEYTRIRAPYAGIVTQRHVEVGESAAPGQRLMTGLSLNELRVNVDVPQSLIEGIRASGRARVLLPQKADASVEATRLTVFPIADPASNTFKLRLDLPPGTPGLFPGMFVKTAFVIGSERLLLIPLRAVAYRSEVTAVYVVADDGRVALRQLRLGRKTGDGQIAVLAGLAEGERVALDPIAAGIAVKDQAGAGR